MLRLTTLLFAGCSLISFGQPEVCQEDLDFDGICDDVDPCVGIVDVLGVCNGGCWFNYDGDLICDDIDNCLDLEACNYDDPTNVDCYYMDNCGLCYPPSEQNVFCPFWEDFFYGLNLVPEQNCTLIDGLLSLSLNANGYVVGIQSGGTTTNIGTWTFNECDCIAGIATGQSQLYLGATLNIPFISYGCGDEDIYLMVDANNNVFAETGCCQIVGSANECLGAFDECGVCDGPGAIYDCGCDLKPVGDCDCNGNVLDVVGVCGGTCQSDFDNNGVCDNQEVFGCSYQLAENYNSDVTHDDGSCIFPCEGVVNTNIFDWDGDHVVTVTDFLMMLSVYGDTDVDLDGVWDSVDECVDTSACNYANVPSEPCAYIDTLGVCGGSCEADEDDDGICDDVDTCVGIEDECGVCNGPGPTEIVIEDITILYDSVFLPQLEEWYVYEYGADTTFSYTCATQSNCNAYDFLGASTTSNFGYVNCSATTAKRNPDLGAGEYDATDGAVRVYGLAEMGVVDGNFFVEDPSAPLTFEYIPETGVAFLKGRVYCRENNAQWFDIDAVFEGAVVASDWLAEDPNHQLLLNDDPNQNGYQLCEIDEEAITVFTMALPSVLTAGGDLSGYLLIEHMPVSLNKRFQLGCGANNHNCNFGFGGMFKWEGTINGEAMSGLSGDIHIDLSGCEAQ